MNLGKAVLWIDGFLLGLGAFAVSIGSVEMVASAVDAIADFFFIECVYFISKSPKLGVTDEKLAKSVSVQLAVSFGFSDFSAYGGVLEKEGGHQCRAALRVVREVNKGEDFGDFKEFYEHHADKVRTGAWLLFTKSLGDNFISELLGEIHLPLDTDIITACISDDVVHFKKVYQVAPSYPIRQSYFGNFSLKRGLSFTRPNLKSFGSVSLEGLRLNVGYIERNRPFTVMRHTARGCVLEGFFGEVWNALENILNISSNYVEVELHREDGDTNSWLKIMKMTKEKQIDVGLGDFIPSITRLENVDFSYPLLTSDFQVFYQDVPSNKRSALYVRVFAIEVWISLFGWAVINSVCISFTTYLCKRFLRKKEPIITAQASFFMTFTGLCAQGSSNIPRFLSSRMLFLLTYMVAAVVVPSYSASLTHYLTTKSSGVTFHNLLNLYEEGFHEIIVVDGSYEYLNLKSDGKSVRRKIFLEHLNGKKLPKTYGTALRMTCKNKNVAFFTVASTLMWELDKRENVDLKDECFLKKMKQNAGKLTNAMIFPKNSRFKGLIDYHLRKLHSTGVISRLQQKYWPNNHNFSTKTWKSATFGDSSGLFNLILTGAVLSILLVILEKTIHETSFEKFSLPPRRK